MGRGRGTTKAKKDTSKKKKQASAEKASGGNEPSGSGGAKVPKRSDVATLPCDPMKNLRACMICSLIKSESEFENEGCDNCERWLKLGGIRGSWTAIQAKTLKEPHNSWVAKWQRISHFKQGIYAVNVRGEVEKWIKEELQQVGDPGLRYFSRDKTRPSNPSATRKKKAARARTRNDSGGDRSIIVDNDDTESTG
ncbi:Transcription elongation factor SPT4-B [Orchesella cincta]|uniref:Transcription elongation factor SPT4-B n=1 Tax=Orchesella cincta TaxID=48709 RepID=A0A1D2MAX9_ORCCI|nr:Transcription elongation factor SPT4-B [Orchesella cincta]